MKDVELALHDDQFIRGYDMLYTNGAIIAKIEGDLHDWHIKFMPTRKSTYYEKKASVYNAMLGNEVFYHISDLKNKLDKLGFVDGSALLYYRGKDVAMVVMNEDETFSAKILTA